MCLSPVLVKWSNKLSEKYINSAHTTYRRLYTGCTAEESWSTLFPDTPMPTWYLRYADKDGKMRRPNGYASKTLPAPTYYQVNKLDGIVCNYATGLKQEVKDRDKEIATYFNLEDFTICHDKQDYLYKTFVTDYEPDTVCMFVPCGCCLECTSKLVRDWTFRVQKDIASNPETCAYMVTLTYRPSCLPTHAIVSADRANKVFKRVKSLFADDEEIPDSLRRVYETLYPDGYNEKDRVTGNIVVEDEEGMLCYTDVQKFLKRLRQTLFRWYDINDLRYFLCGEYGSKHHRPHYHLLLWFTPTERSKRKQHFDVKKHRGVKSFQFDYVNRHRGRLDVLTCMELRRICLGCWTYADYLALDCSEVRSKAASSAYICKYLVKNKCNEKKDGVSVAYNFLMCPCIYRSSVKLGYQWADNNPYDMQKGYVTEVYADKEGNKHTKCTVIPKALRIRGDRYDLANLSIKKKFVEPLNNLTYEQLLQRRKESNATYRLRQVGMCRNERPDE